MVKFSLSASARRPYSILPSVSLHNIPFLDLLNHKHYRRPSSHAEHITINQTQWRSLASLESRAKPDLAQASACLGWFPDILAGVSIVIRLRRYSSNTTCISDILSQPIKYRSSSAPRCDGAQSYADFLTVRSRTAGLPD